MHSRWLGYNLAIVPLDSFRHARARAREREKWEGRGGCHDIPMKYRMSALTSREHNADIQTYRGTTSANNKPSVVWLFAIPFFFSRPSISLLELLRLSYFNRQVQIPPRENNEFWVWWKRFWWKCLLHKPVATSGYVVNKVNGQDGFEVRLFEFSA